MEQYTEEKIIEIVNAYVSLVEAKNMLEKMKDGEIKRSPYNLAKIKKIGQETILKYLEVVPSQIRNVLPLKASDLEILII